MTRKRVIMVDKNGFISQEIMKKIMQLENINGENQELEPELLLRNLLAGTGNCSLGDLHDREVVARLQTIVERQIGEMNKRKEELHSDSTLVPIQSAPESDMACGTTSN